MGSICILLLTVLALAPAPRLCAQSITHGLFLGHVEATSVRCWARVSAAGEYRLSLRNEAGGAPLVGVASTDAERDFTLSWHVTGLRPDSLHRYEIWSGETRLVGGDEHTFRTPGAAPAAVATVAFGSCANHDRFPKPAIWRAIGASGAEALVFLGDTPYIDSTDLGVQRRRYRELYANDDLRDLLRSTPLYAVWDDHDFGRNDTAGDLPGKENARRAFVEFHANPSYGDGEQGIYTSFRRGPIEVFLLDTRWFARTAPSPVAPQEPTLLGAAQWQWLKRALAASTAPFKILASGMIWNGATRPLKPDHWMSYPHERDALFRFIGERGISGVVLVGGDIHRSRAMLHATAAQAGYELTELITSPMANTVIEAANAPSPHLQWDVGVQQTFLSVRADASVDPPLLVAEFRDPEAVLHRIELRADELAWPADRETVWHDVRALGIEGKAWQETQAPFDRLPAAAKGAVRGAVWNLSRMSAGMCVRFVTDATRIAARWTLTSDRLAMPHMPATGVSGLDLYARDGAGSWRWLGVGRPVAQSNEVVLTSGLQAGEREFLLYLPLYNGVTSVEVGVPRGATFAPGPLRAPKRRAPIVFYGTSITQGGCASRPGMVHTALLGRRLDRPVVNLGFSGNGKMEPAVTALLTEIDAACYVIDCLPNMSEDQVTERTEPLVRTLRAARPATPIVLVEDRSYQNAFLRNSLRKRNATSRAALLAVYNRLVSDGVPGLHYLEGAALLGEDGEATVDGSHPTDLGFVRQADAFEALLRQLVDG